MIEVRWHGRGGQGCWTAARLLGLAATIFENKYALAFPSFGPERRGAPTLGFTKIDEKPIYDRSEVRACDYIIVLDETVIEKNTFVGLKKDGMVIINTTSLNKYKKYPRNINLIDFDATFLAMKIFGKPIVNTAMLGCLVTLSNIVSIDSIVKAIQEDMEGSIRESNIKIVKLTYNEMKARK